VAVECGGRIQPRLELPAGLDSEVVLEPGEQLGDGIHADPSAWDPHAIYSFERTRGGVRLATPHLTFKPAVAGLYANVILTTDRRTYRFFLSSVKSDRPLYATCTYPLVRVVPAPPTGSGFAVTPPAPDATPAATSTPEPELRALCNDFAFPKKRMVVTGGAGFVPEAVCSDGYHTYVQLSYTPPMAPALWVVGDDGRDEIANFSFSIRTLRYKLDGVYPRIALILGAGRTEKRVVIVHE
jgi:type IV secretion system protein VirB9